MKPNQGWLIILQTLSTTKDAVTLTLEDMPVPAIGSLVCYNGRDGKSVTGMVVAVKYDYRSREVIVTLGAS